MTLMTLRGGNEVDMLSVMLPPGELRFLFKVVTVHILCCSVVVANKISIVVDASLLVIVIDFCEA